MQRSMLEQKFNSHRAKKFCLRNADCMNFWPPILSVQRLPANQQNGCGKDKDGHGMEAQSISLEKLSEEVLVLILECLDARSLIQMSKTSRLFKRLCLSDLIWRHRCRVDFGLVTRWPEYSYIYLYEMFYKADVLKMDPNFFRPVSQLKTSVIVWYLLSRQPPSLSVSQLTASQAKSIWGFTDEELESHHQHLGLLQNNHDDRNGDAVASTFYDWCSLYKLFVTKHGGLREMQIYVLKRCLRNRQALEEHYQLSLHSSRQQKWYQFVEDRDLGNQKALKALTEHMPKVTHSYMLHQITANYIDGRLKGGFQTVKAYAEFCGYFKTWLDAKSIKLWPPRQGEMVAQDYRECLEFVNKELASFAEEYELRMIDFLGKAKPYVERLHEVWLWQNRKGTSYRKEHRPTSVIKRHKGYKQFLERSSLEAFTQLKLYFERKEVLVAWYKENSWLHSLLGDYVVRPLRPACISTELTTGHHYSSDCVSELVQRFFETGLRSDFNKVRMKLSEMANMQLQALMRKSQQLRDNINQELRVMKEDCMYVHDYEDAGVFQPYRNLHRVSFPNFNQHLEVITLD